MRLESSVAPSAAGLDVYRLFGYIPGPSLFDIAAITLLPLPASADFLEIGKYGK
jgi:hypothetical protein